MGEDDVIKQDICRDQWVPGMSEGYFQDQTGNLVPLSGLRGQVLFRQAGAPATCLVMLCTRAHTCVKILGSCCGGGAGSCQGSWREGGVPLTATHTSLWCMWKVGQIAHQA